MEAGRLLLGTQPLVHGGFLQSWLSDGLHKRVLHRVREIIRESTVDREDFHIYVTGQHTALIQH